MAPLKIFRGMELLRQVSTAGAVLKNGEIVEQGSHAQLISRPTGAYSTLLKLQLAAQDEAHDSMEKNLLSTEDLDVVYQSSVHGSAQVICTLLLVSVPGGLLIHHVVPCKAPRMDSLNKCSGPSCNVHGPALPPAEA